MAHTLFIRDGESFREAPAQEIIDRAAALIAQRFRSGSPALQSPERTRQYLRHQIGALPYEVFGLLLLDLCVARGYVARVLGNAENSGPGANRAQH
jgi:hypothetical protein